MTSDDQSTIELLGVKANPMTRQDVLAHIKAAVDTDQRGHIVGNHNLHSVYLFHHDEQMRAFYSRCHAVFIDSMILVTFARLLGYQVNRTHRITPLDWIRPLFQLAAEEQWRVFYLGSKEEVTTHGLNLLREEIPGLNVRHHHGYFDVDQTGQANQNVLDQINHFRPDILIVGMGMPRQEKWILVNASDLNAKVIMNWGATIDYIAGAVPTPPRWMGQLGLEWLYRLVSEPGRLWRRYLVEPWSLARPAMRDVSRRLRGRRPDDSSNV